MASPAPSTKTTRNSYMHNAWSVGHMIVLFFTVYLYLGLFVFRPRAWAYYTAYAGAIMSWAIVVYKSLGIPSLSRAYIHKAALDENVQYLAVALYWFFTKPIYVTLLPFAIFSTFHTLTFLRNNWLKPAPAKKDGAGAAQPAVDWSANLNKQIQIWVKRNYETAMTAVAMIEVVGIMARLTLGAITFQNSFLHPIFFGHFLRLRYYLSPSTRHAFTLVNGYVDEGLKHPSCPEPVRKGVNTARSLIVRYAESILSVPAAQEQPARPAGAGAARPAAH